MQVAFGVRAHSGWAAVVGIARGNGGFVVCERRRIELVEQPWAKQPYHAAENLSPGRARDTVARGIDAADRIAAREMRALIQRQQEQGHDVTACALVAGTPMPAWTVDEIIAVHFRMHKAEGALFRDALARAAEVCGLRLVAIPEKQLASHAARALATTPGRLTARIAALGKTAGAPWGKDQKDAALAAMVALQAPNAAVMSG
jgi:hypothetical protein